MFLHRLYYHIKPAIPRRIQIALRRILVRHQLRRHRDVWPIDQRAGTQPPGWSGWPEGKRFSLILTHDVETARGQKKCRQLAELEMSKGFRSSFNFVAEDYAPDRELHRFLLDNGFEIGLHGLTHSGNFFSPAGRFLKEASRINHYLKEWGAVGFRAPSMNRDFRLLQLLDILYDSSSFDTDPFEPQPEGVRSIFPFVPTSTNSRNSINSFIELPYTLPQDHTLFVLMRQKDIAIWKEKLAWIVQKGGMALLNAHPDYMDFGGSENSGLTYPAGLYEDFLEHVRSKYEGSYWHALPREVATFWKEHR